MDFIDFFVNSLLAALLVLPLLGTGIALALQFAGLAGRRLDEPWPPLRLPAAQPAEDVDANATADARAAAIAQRRARALQRRAARRSTQAAQECRLLLAQLRQQRPAGRVDVGQPAGTPPAAPHPQAAATSSGSGVDPGCGRPQCLSGCRPECRRAALEALIGP